MWYNWLLYYYTILTNKYGVMEIIACLSHIAFIHSDTKKGGNKPNLNLNDYNFFSCKRKYVIMILKWEKESSLIKPQDNLY